MARGNLPSCLNITLKHEGGYVDHPRDPGGATNMGVTRATLAAWRGRPVKKQEVRDLSLGVATEIYEARYWQKVRGDKLPYGLDLSTFDAGVNSGNSRGIKWLQRAVGETEDGKFGSLTLKAVNAVRDMPATINKVNDVRLSFMRSLRIWSTFGKGWSRRVADIRASSIAMWMRAAGVSAAGQKEILTTERDRAAQTTTRQGQGAGGAAAGGGGTVAIDQGANLGQWLTWGLLAVTLLVVAMLVVRALVNRDRANAFNAELNKLKEVK